jgi:probable addiction module antidote protein
MTRFDGDGDWSGRTLAGNVGGSREGRLWRENLYRALGGDAKPEFGTVIKVLHALGIALIAQPNAEEAA